MRHTACKTARAHNITHDNQLILHFCSSCLIKKQELSVVISACVFGVRCVKDKKKVVLNWTTFFNNKVNLKSEKKTTTQGFVVL